MKALWDERVSWHQCRWQDAENDPSLPLIAIVPGLRDACLSRKRDFLAGRLCAHKALQGLPFPKITRRSERIELAMGPNGEPLWDEGVVGSISHTLDIACAVVGSSEHFAGIGIDLQEYMRLDQLRYAKEVVANTHERERQPGCLDEWRYFTLLFSAKESVYKACFPTERRFMDFGDVEIQLQDPWDGTFQTRFLGDFSRLNAGAGNVKGYFHFGPSMVRTLVLRERGDAIREVAGG